MTVLKHCPKLKTLEIAEQQFKVDFLEFLHQKELRICYKKTARRPLSSGNTPTSSTIPPVASSLFDGIVLGMTDVPGFSGK